METVKRHSVTVRLNHWAIAVSGIFLLFSGFGQMPMYKRYNIVKIPGLAWSSNYEITLLMHYVAAALFGAAVLYHIIYHFRRKEFGILPKKGDVGEAIAGFKAMLGRDEEPAHGKFQAKQRVIYAIMGSASLALLLTGLVKSYKNLGNIVIDHMLLEAITLAHTIFGMLFMMLFLAHVGALLLKNHRPLIPSMFSGRISKEYADHHHPKWDPGKE